MKYTTVICVTSFSLFFSACTRSSVDVEAEKVALLAAADVYHETTHRGEWASLIESDANDVLILPPNAAAINGLEEARNFFAAAPDVEIRYGDVTAAVAASGDMGYTLTSGVATFEGPDGNLAEDKFRDFHVWKKQDGEWKIAIDIWSSELPLPGVEDTSEADREAINNVTEQVTEAYIARDWDRFSGHFTEDAIWMPDDILPLTGKAAWWSFVEQFWDSTAVVEMDLVSDEIIVSGDWAFERHTENTVTGPTAGDGDSSTSRYKGVWLFHREADGSWKIARYIWNWNPAPN